MELAKHAAVAEVTKQIIERSKTERAAYIELMQSQFDHRPPRSRLSCGNLAHGIAACSPSDKQIIRMMNAVNVGIVTAYNDMLSAHQPYQSYPDQIKRELASLGSTAQVAGGVPAMCDGVTQGQAGMELSLFSRDVIAMSTAVSLSHDMFDAVMCLGICDKIVPGLLIGALRFGYLPCVFVPAGPMPSGLSNKEKARVRQEFAQGKVDQNALLDSESKAYHSAGTCTFYGTANSNQLLVEVMGLQLPGSSFVNPDTELRYALTNAAARQAVKLSDVTGNYRPLYEIVTPETIVNAMVALLATGGSTNHTIHLVAIAKAAGISINWDDFARLSAAVPLLTRIYPNGEADINHFQNAGGMSVLIAAMLDLGLLNTGVKTILGDGLESYLETPAIKGGVLTWKRSSTESSNESVLAKPNSPFAKEGGLKVLQGNLGRSVIKVSAVAEEHRKVSAPAVVFDSQHDVEAAFKRGDLDKDCVVVVRYQGPKANGMPELHKLTPSLSVLQNKGFQVALVTDGRMSGASGKVPAAIHLYPEAIEGGLIGKICDGDLLELDAELGVLRVDVEESELAKRDAASRSAIIKGEGVGRELFFGMRAQVSHPEEGACVLLP